MPPLPQLLPAAVLVALALSSVVYAQQTYWAVDAPIFLGSILAFGTLSALLFGPSRLMLTIILVYAITCHPFRSMAVVPVFGVEWHPRELWMILLLAHGIIKVWQRRLSLGWTPFHLCLLLYTVFFAYAAWRGLWLSNPPQAIIAELRAPFFLLAFWVIVGVVRRPGDLHYYGYVATATVTLMALAALVIFGYGMLAGPWPNTQNALGEFVPRRAFGTTFQSVRLSGHVWFEGGLVLCMALFWCPTEAWIRRFIYAALGALYAAAIGAGMMRTALVSVAISLAALIWLNLPRAAKGLTVGLAGMALVVVLGVLVIVGDGAYSVVPGASVNARLVESAGALDAIMAYPFFGAGLGASFESLGLATRSGGDSAIPTDYDSLHNVWLYMAWKGGLVGLGAVLAALAGLLFYSTSVTRRLATMGERCLARGLQAVLLGQLAASCTMPRLTYANGALFLVIWTAAFVLLDRASRESRRAVTVPPVDAPAPERGGEDELLEDDPNDPFERPAPYVPSVPEIGGKEEVLEDDPDDPFERPAPYVPPAPEIGAKEVVSEDAPDDPFERPTPYAPPAPESL